MEQRGISAKSIHKIGCIPKTTSLTTTMRNKGAWWLSFFVKKLVKYPFKINTSLFYVFFASKTSRHGNYSNRAILRFRHYEASLRAMRTPSHSMRCPSSVSRFNSPTLHFSASHFTQEDLDSGPLKSTTQAHVRLLNPREETEVLLDGFISGVGCVNSWGALPLPSYRLPYGDYAFEYAIVPVRQAL